LTVIFAFLGSEWVKAGHKTLVKLTPGYREYPSSTDLVAQAAIALGSLGLLATVAYIPFYIGLDGSTVVGRSGGPLEKMAGLADSWSRAFGMEECGQVSYLNLSNFLN